MKQNITITEAQERITANLLTIRQTYTILGWDCLTKEAENKVNCFHKLDSLMTFSETPEDLAKQIREDKEEVSKEVYHLLKKYMRAHFKITIEED